MLIKEFIQIAEEFYGNDEKANQRNTPLWLIKTYAEITLDNYNKISEVSEYEIDEVELLSIIMLEGFAYNLIQEAAFNPDRLDVVSSTLICALDNALVKIPKNTENILYRNDNDNFRDYNVGDQITFNGFFTTSKDDFDNASSIKWIITPLDTDNTKAHEIYRVWNHGEDFSVPENQIEFERGVTFIVTAIEKAESFRIIHITEIS